MKIVKVSLEAQRVQLGNLNLGDCFVDEAHVSTHPDMSFVQVKLQDNIAVYLEDGSQDFISNDDWVYYATEVILGVE